MSPIPETTALPPITAGADALGVLLQVELPVTVSVGKARMSLRELLKLGAGSVVELDRIAGDPVDIIVNNRIFARGEIVLADDNYAVRIQEIYREESNPLLMPVPEA